MEAFRNLQVASFLLTIVTAGATVVGRNADNDGLTYGGLGGEAAPVDRAGH